MMIFLSSLAEERFFFVNLQRKIEETTYDCLDYSNSLILCMKKVGNK